MEYVNEYYDNENRINNMKKYLLALPIILGIIMMGIVVIMGNEIYQDDLKIVFLENEILRKELDLYQRSEK